MGYGNGCPDRNILSRFSRYLSAGIRFSVILFPRRSWARDCFDDRVRLLLPGQIQQRDRGCPAVR